jgi:hypothetical protein
MDRMFDCEAQSRLIGCVVIIARTESSAEFIEKAVLNRAPRSGIEPPRIVPTMPHRNAHVESFDGRLPDECLNGQRLMSLAYARA